MDFQKLAEVYEELEQTSSGNKMREILAEFFKKVPEEEIVHIAYLTLGKLSADYDEVVLGLAEKSVLKAIAMAGGIDVTKAAKIMQETGDIGLTAEKLLQKKPQTLVPLGKLTVKELFEKLHKIAEISGSGSQDQKASILVSLLQKATPVGAKYVARIVLGTMRLGSGDMAVLDALAIAFTGGKENKKYLEAAYNICPDLGIIADTVVKSGLKGIQKIDIKVGRPIKMMLCQRVENLEEIPEKIPGEVTVEAKYDGERVQAHRNSKGKIVLYSRRLENITSQFPDLVDALGKQLPAKEWIVEGEILAVDEKGHPLPFQTLMQRRRKYDVEDYAQKIPVMLKLFDLLYWEGESFLHTS
ncbi:MAG: ATP-dependent DNA ligase, partial [Nanoarchaeota archaeon]